MRKTKVIGLDSFLKQVKDDVTQHWVAEQNDRLVEYANRKIRLLGDAIQLYNSKKHMDRTGNLLDSLCWGVGYDGKNVATGFYRENPSRRGDSYLHEYTPDDAIHVNGRELANNFLQSYNYPDKKWVVFFAILAPYWGYWESGHRSKSGGSTVYQTEHDFPEHLQRDIPKSMTFKQFQVMSFLYDEVRMDLKPATTRLTVYVPKYSYKNNKYKNKRGYYRFGVQR